MNTYNRNNFIDSNTLSNEKNILSSYNHSPSPNQRKSIENVYGLNMKEFREKIEEFKYKYPYIKESQLHILVIYDSALNKLRRVVDHKKYSTKAETFYKLDKFSKNNKHFRLITMYMSKLLNNIFNKKVEMFFLVYKKQKFLEDVNLQKKILKGPFQTVNKMWHNKLFSCFNKLRIFKNIVNNYEYHIQPFQKRSLKNNIIGLLRQMKINNHLNQRKMLKDPCALKQNLFLLISSNLIKGKTEEFMDYFFRIIKGQNKKLTEEEKKFKRFEFALRAMIRNRYALFFRDIVIHDKSVFDDNRSHLSKISKFTNNRHPGFRGNGNYNNQSNVEKYKGQNPNDNYDNESYILKGTMSFENKNAQKNGSYENNYMSEFDRDNEKNGFDILFDKNNNNINNAEVLKAFYRKHPKYYLPFLLKNIFTKRRKPIFEYMKLMLMLQKFENNNGNDLKLLSQMRSKFGESKGMSLKFFVIYINKLIKLKAMNIKLGVFQKLKNKKIKIHKVLFGKVKPVKVQTSPFLGNPRMSIANFQNNYRNNFNTHSQMVLPYQIQPDNISACKYNIINLFFYFYFFNIII